MENKEKIAVVRLCFPKVNTVEYSYKVMPDMAVEVGDVVLVSNHRHTKENLCQTDILRGALYAEVIAVYNSPSDYILNKKDSNHEYAKISKYIVSNLQKDTEAYITAMAQSNEKRKLLKKIDKKIASMETESRYQFYYKHTNDEELKSMMEEAGLV